MKKPKLPCALSELPPPPYPSIVSCLPILERCDEFLVSCLGRGRESPAGIEFPSTAPRDKGFVTMVEWPLRPGDTKIEAYFVGTNRARSHWFLWDFTVDDLMPFDLTYLEKRVVAFTERRELSKPDAAIVLLMRQWEYEKESSDMSHFMLVSDSGLITSNAAFEIGNRVWPQKRRT